MTSGVSRDIPRSLQANVGLPPQVATPSFRVQIYTIVRCRGIVVIHCIKPQRNKGKTKVCADAAKINDSFDRKCTVFINATNLSTNAMLNEVFVALGYIVR